jgi:hypothetical protein
MSNKFEIGEADLGKKERGDLTGGQERDSEEGVYLEAAAIIELLLDRETLSI